MGAIFSLYRQVSCAVVASLALAACGGGSSDDGTTMTPPDTNPETSGGGEETSSPDETSLQDIEQAVSAYPFASADLEARFDCLLRDQATVAASERVPGPRLEESSLFLLASWCRVGAASGSGACDGIDPDVSTSGRDHKRIELTLFKERKTEPSRLDALVLGVESYPDPARGEWVVSFTRSFDAVSEGGNGNGLPDSYNLFLAGGDDALAGPASTLSLASPMTFSIPLSSTANESLRTVPVTLAQTTSAAADLASLTSDAESFRRTADARLDEVLVAAERLIADGELAYEVCSGVAGCGSAGPLPPELAAEALDTLRTETARRQTIVDTYGDDMHRALAEHVSIDQCP